MNASNTLAWPAILTDRDAARYLSVEVSIFKAIAEENGVYPVNVDDNQVRWKKRDLDLLVGKMSYDTAYFAKRSVGNAVRLDNQTIVAIADAVRVEIEGVGKDGSIAKLVSINNAGQLLGVGRSTVYRLLEDGTLTKKKVGRRTLITRTSIDRLLDNQ